LKYNRSSNRIIEFKATLFVQNLRFETSRSQALSDLDSGSAKPLRGGNEKKGVKKNFLPKIYFYSLPIAK
jgi:hypothetical protein